MRTPDHVASTLRKSSSPRCSRRRVKTIRGSPVDALVRRGTRSRTDVLGPTIVTAVCATRHNRSLTAGQFPRVRVWTFGKSKSGRSVVIRSILSIELECKRHDCSQGAREIFPFPGEKARRDLVEDGAWIRGRHGDRCLPHRALNRIDWTDVRVDFLQSRPFQSNSRGSTSIGLTPSSSGRYTKFGRYTKGTSRRCPSSGAWRTKIELGSSRRCARESEKNARRAKRRDKGEKEKKGEKERSSSWMDPSLDASFFVSSRRHLGLPPRRHEGHHHLQHHHHHHQGHPPGRQHPPSRHHYRLLFANVCTLAPIGRIQ